MIVCEPEVSAGSPCMEEAPERELLPEPGLIVHRLTGCARNEHVAAKTRNGVPSAQPGIKLTTYRIMGSFNEQENSDSDARPAKPGKPPSPAMFRAEDGALVVVGARESRAHGEGEQ
jgi:hypothetical protein